MRWWRRHDGKGQGPTNTKSRRHTTDVAPRVDTSPQEEDSTHSLVTPESRALAATRFKHLRSLGIEWEGLRVLDVGSGPGLLAEHLAGLGAEVTCVDERGDLLDEARRRVPALRTAMVDLQRDPLLPLGRFEVVLAYGLLRHLAEPLRALRNMVAVCDDILVLETTTLDHALPLVRLVDEPAQANQALDGLACRPTPSWVALALERLGMAAVYGVAVEPDHPEFGSPALNTLESDRDGNNLRRVFVAARRPLELPGLVPMTREQAARPVKIVLDVGAHRGETTMGLAERDPTVVVYAFEPLPGFAEALNRRLPNYHAWPLAVAATDGEAEFHVNQFSFTSSLRKAWPEGGEVGTVYDVPVATRRLDTFCDEHGIRRIELLKIDAQGADLEVLQSLGRRLDDVEQVLVEAQIAGPDMYEGTPGPESIMSLLEQAGFEFVGESVQSEGRETNLRYRRAMGAVRVLAATWEAAEANGSAIVEPHAGALEIVTPPEPWSYAALVPIDAGESAPVAVRVTIAVHEGRIGLGLLRTITDVAVEFSIDAGRQETVDLPVLSPSDTWRLVVRNNALPVPSRCTVSQLALVFRAD